MLQQFVLFLKHRNELTLDDSAYLSSIPGMMDWHKGGREHSFVRVRSAKDLISIYYIPFDE
jgi:hypothetical protein